MPGLSVIVPGSLVFSLGNFGYRIGKDSVSEWVYGVIIVKMNVKNCSGNDCAAHRHSSALSDH
jgi:hypothetical protein